MSGLHWLVLITIWLLAGIGWCILFAVMGLRYEADLEAVPSPGNDIDDADSDLASAA